MARAAAASFAVGAVAMLLVGCGSSASEAAARSVSRSGRHAFHGSALERVDCVDAGKHRFGSAVAARTFACDARYALTPPITLRWLAFRAGGRYRVWGCPRLSAPITEPLCWKPLARLR